MHPDAVQMNMTPSHPGEFIRDEVLAECGLSVTEAAKILGVRRATLSDLLNEKTALSPEMALRVEKAFGLSMDIMLRMQAWYDAHAQARRRDRGRAVSARLIPARRTLTPRPLRPAGEDGPDAVGRRTSPSGTATRRWRCG